MKLALLGYGRMGKTIEVIALDRGHEIVLTLDKSEDNIDFKQADVAIDFSVPESAFANISQALKHDVPIVSGTTGWLERYDEAVDFCKQLNGSFLYASNFSPGVNLFFELNTYLAQLMQNQGYQTSIDETHHIHKLDAPSGTAISLADQVLPYTDYNGWELVSFCETGKDKLPIRAHREEQVPGTHEIHYKSEVDDISIKHTAHSRQGFALGAVMAAEYIKDKKGIFSMKEVLGLDRLTH